MNFFHLKKIDFKLNFSVSRHNKIPVYYFTFTKAFRHILDGNNK